MANTKLSFIIRILSVLIKNISPDIKELIADSIEKLDIRAQSTKNQFDDLLDVFSLAEN